MPRSSTVRLSIGRLLAAASLLTAASHAAAGEDAPSVFLQAGAGEEAVRAVSGGVAWSLPWRSASGQFTARAEVFASLWRTPRPGDGHRTLVQIGVVPMLRLHADGGRSPWFIEGGVGLSWLDGELRTPQRTFSTRLNFSDNVGFGRSFGVKGEQEWSLRWQHTSNAGIRKPNPGQDLLLARYAHSF